ncbi:protein sym-1 [Elaeis guineensis]|uniref:Protein sym-1 n=1 Tax=Elaeis guineensis var. tenera TaxID=51953 RepID=A0A6I9Q8P2_ELAGV|nr:protein sym-1 [Elaeis guineensis]XP_010904733.1 protein sym-1 [Elaeis guineensis]XP_019701729.1 protein sym-1 [Elaeis guineensis]
MLRCAARMAAIFRKSPLPFETLSLPNKPMSRLPNPTPISSILGRRSHSGVRFPCYSLQSLPNSTSGGGLRDMGRLGFGFGPKDLDFVRVRVVSVGGSGSTGEGGGYRGWGNGGSGGGAGNERGGNDWFFFSWYMMALDKYPVTTKAITSAFLTLIGDLICQLLIDQVSKLDFRRTFVFTLLGLVLVGPTLHFWYLYLSRLVTVPGASGAFLRLLLDQFVFSPIFIGLVLTLLVTLEGRPSHIKPKLQQEWFSSVVANWQLWIPFQFLNFRFVPQKFQVLAANFVALAWNVILSFKAHKEVVLK